MAARLAVLLVFVALGCEDDEYKVSCGTPNAGNYEDTCPGTGACPTPPAGQGCVGLPDLGDEVKEGLAHHGATDDMSFPVGCTLWFPSKASGWGYCTCGAYWPGPEHPRDWFCAQ